MVVKSMDVWSQSHSTLSASSHKQCSHVLGLGRAIVPVLYLQGERLRLGSGECRDTIGHAEIQVRVTDHNKHTR